MDLETFTNRIKQTILLAEENKAYFLAEADKYQPELLEELIRELEMHERDFVKEGKKQIADMAHKGMIKVETHHRQQEAYEKAQAEDKMRIDLLKSE